MAGQGKKMVFTIGIPKGLTQVLKGGGKYRPGMKLEKYEKKLQVIKASKKRKRGLSTTFMVKALDVYSFLNFTVRLTPLNGSGLKSKRYTRSHWNYSIVCLSRNVPLGLDSVILENIQIESL